MSALSRWNSGTFGSRLPGKLLASSHNVGMSSRGGTRTCIRSGSLRRLVWAIPIDVVEGSKSIIVGASTKASTAASWMLEFAVLCYV